MLVLAAVPNVAMTYIIDSYSGRTSDAMMTLNVTRNIVGASFLFWMSPLMQRAEIKTVR
jgi:hypothetical protein